MISSSFKSSITTTTAMKMLVASVLMCLVLAIRAEFDLSNINVSELPSDFPKPNVAIDDAKTLLKDKCIKQAGKANGTAAFNDIESSVMVMAECVNGIINFTAIQDEINVASPKGELDVVFNKYCLKRPDAITCIESFVDKLTPCLDAEERESQDTVLRIIKSLLNFVCYKGGDQIALFISEKGPECLQSHRDDIQNCFNSTFSGYFPAEGFENMQTLPKLVMDAQQCEDLERFETCIVKKLETCEEITPANIVESMFRFIKNETICRSTSKTNKLTAHNSGTNTMGVLTMPALFLVIFVQAITYFNRKQQAV